MVDGMSDVSGQHVLDNPTRLKLYLHIRRNKKPVGIRETQRALDIASPSTVSWHFEKLVDASLLIKTPNNLYYVDPDTRIEENLTVQVSFTLRFFREHLVTPLSFIFYFLLSMIILTFVIWIGSRNPLFIGLQGLFSLIVSSITIFYIWKQVRDEIRELESS